MLRRPRPFTVWIDMSIFRLEDNKVLSIEKNRKTSNTKIILSPDTPENWAEVALRFKEF